MEAWLLDNITLVDTTGFQALGSLGQFLRDPYLGAQDVVARYITFGGTTGSGSYSKGSFCDPP